MTHRRYANKVDSNQPKIVRDLRKIPGVSVSPGHDDILVGFRGRTFWFEIKNPDKLKKNGKLKKGALQDGQVQLQNEFNGHYSVVTSLDEILQQIGVTNAA